MAGKVFISYRRDDDPSAAARVRDALAARFGKANLFMDIDSLSAGQRFEAELAKALTACDVFIAIIGPRWMDLLWAKSQMSGLRDFVRDEIALALKRKLMVVPVRVGRENNLPPLPRAKDLPSDIRDLVNYQKHDVVHENFARDIAGLMEAITRARGSSTPKRTFPWEWAGAAASIAISVSLLVYVLHTNPVKVTWAPSAQVSAPVPVASEAAREWARVDKSDIAELETFLRRHSSSPEADYARARVEAMKRREVAIAAPPPQQQQPSAPVPAEPAPTAPSANGEQWVKDFFAQHFSPPAAISPPRTQPSVTVAPEAGRSCSDTCKAGYGTCYRATQDRATCQPQLQRCLEVCIRAGR